jgi:hypothetical protein
MVEGREQIGFKRSEELLLCTERGAKPNEDERQPP